MLSWIWSCLVVPTAVVAKTWIVAKGCSKHEVVAKTWIKHKLSISPPAPEYQMDRALTVIPKKPPHFSRLIRRPWGYGGSIIILNPGSPMESIWIKSIYNNIIARNVYYNDIFTEILKSWKWCRSFGLASSRVLQVRMKVCQSEKSRISDLWLYNKITISFNTFNHIIWWIWSKIN